MHVARSKKTLSSASRTSFRRFSTIFLAALGSLSMNAHAVAQAESSEIKSPRPLLSASDVKTPAPAPKKPKTQQYPVEPRALRASAPAKSAAMPPALAGIQSPLMNRLVWDIDADGSIWVRGSTYKARFDARGMTYIPFTGSNAPRNLPVHFALAEATVGGESMPLIAPPSAKREGNRISIDRGDVVEVYDVELDSIEQSFVFESIRKTGEIVLRVAALTEMETDADAAGGLIFSGTRGGVKYSHAVALDAGGRMSQASTSLQGSDIEIVVPGQFAAAATLPLVVDPVISSFSAEISVDEAVVSDVAYDATTHSYFVAWEMNFSDADGDMYCDTFDSNGQSKGTFTSIDISGDNWRNPACANNNIADSFLVAAEVGAAPNRVIKGRTRLAASGPAGAPFLISGAEAGDKHNPTAGGDPHTLGPTFYCVAWQRDVSGTDTDIHARLITSAGAPEGNNVIFLSNSAASLDGSPSISKSDGLPPSNSQVWTVVWERNYLVGDTDIYGAQLDWDGNIRHNPFAIDTADAVHHHPTVSTVLDSTGGIGSRPFMVAYDEITANNNRDIVARVFTGNTMMTDANLSALQVVKRAQDQHTPAVDSDGIKFIVAHTEMYDTDPNDYDVMVSSFCLLNDELAASENRRVIAGLLYFEHLPRIASVHAAGGPEPIMLLSWQYDSTVGHGNIGGGFYQSRATCGCAADIAASFGVVNVTDLFLVINFWGANGANFPADINGDQQVNVADLLAVIASWGECP